MEGSKDMSLNVSLKEDLLRHKIPVSIILGFHLIGLIGLSLPYSHALFLTLVPYHLLLMGMVIIFSHQHTEVKFLSFALVIIISGCAAEWAGVNKHWLFGDYTYSNTLGVKLLGVPLLVGVNWFLLIYSFGVVMQRSRLKSAFFRIVCGALLLVLLDLLIEPVAVRFDYWHWSSNFVPFKNYICWFFVGGVLLTIFELFRFKKQSIVAPVLLSAQFIFFGILYLVQVIFLA